MTPRTLEEQLKLTWKHLPSVSAKLAFLTAVRDPYSGKYIHEGWTHFGSSEEIHEMLRSTHRALFEMLCALSISALCAELNMYFTTLSSPQKETVRLWRELEPFREMVPEGISVEERDFFVSQMRAAMAVLVIAPDWSLLREPASLQFRQPDQLFQPHRGS